MVRMFFGWLRTALAVAVLLAIPAYSLCSILPCGSTTETVTLADGDDPTCFGFGVVTAPPRSEASAAKTSTDPAAIVLLTDWMYTAKAKPSPYK